VYIYYIDDVHGFRRRRKRADHMLHKQIGKEIFGFVHNGYLFSLLPVHWDRRKRIAIVSSHVMDKNRVVLHVDFFFVDGNNAYSVDSHV